MASVAADVLDLAASVGKQAKETFLEGTRSAKRARKSRETMASCGGFWEVAVSWLDVEV